ncbi:MAG: M48 family metalloprotease [Acidobacteriota bacterium]
MHRPPPSRRRQHTPWRPFVIPHLALWLLSAGLVPAPAAAQKIADAKLYAESLEFASKVFEEYGEWDNPEALRRVADIGYRVAQESGYEGYPLTFHLVDMPEPNAFALPAGHIFVTRGMLDLDLTDDMLAALMGHEIGHVVFEHHLKMKRRATLMSVLSSALLIGVAVGASESGSREVPSGPYRSPEPYGSGDRIQGAAAAGLIVNELLLRSFSREHEDQSDEEGQRWAAAAGYSPNGTRALMERMSSRIPQAEKYGYWHTHPFFSDRVRAAGAREDLLKRQPPSDAAEFRRRTQAALVAEIEKLTPAAATPRAGGARRPPSDSTTDKANPALIPLLRLEALTAWPVGPAAEKIRFDTLHELRATELARADIERDYGRLLAAYHEQIDEVAELSPRSTALPPMQAERDALDRERRALYPKARDILAGDVFETAFLERFLSNFPDAPEVPKAALALGESHSRLGNQTEAVGRFLQSWRAAPESSEGQRAAAGLRNLTPYLEQLSALEQLVQQTDDKALAALASQRLDEIAGHFTEIDNGAEYLRRFPAGSRTEPVAERVDALADKLYAEVVLYQALGDNVKALERIQKILAHAPRSHAAEQLRDQAAKESPS